jgi:hypothetical protein
MKCRSLFERVGWHFQVEAGPCACPVFRHSARSRRMTEWVMRLNGVIAGLTRNLEIMP